MKPKVLANLFKLFCKILIFLQKCSDNPARKTGFRKFPPGSVLATPSTPAADDRVRAAEKLSETQSPCRTVQTILQNFDFSTKMFKQSCMENGFQKVSSGRMAQ